MKKIRKWAKDTKEKRKFVSGMSYSETLSIIVSNRYCPDSENRGNKKEKKL